MLQLEKRSAVSEFVRAQTHGSDRLLVELTVWLQATVLLELLDGGLRALAPDTIDIARIETEIVQARLNLPHRRPAESVGRGLRQVGDRPNAEESSGAEAQCVHAGLIELAGGLKLPGSLEALQRSLAVWAPHAVHGAAVCTGCAEVVLHGLNGDRGYGLNEGERGRRGLAERRGRGEDHDR